MGSRAYAPVLSLFFLSFRFLNRNKHFWCVCLIVFALLGFRLCPMSIPRVPFSMLPINSGYLYVRHIISHILTCLKFRKVAAYQKIAFSSTYLLQRIYAAAMPLSHSLSTSLSHSPMCMFVCNRGKKTGTTEWTNIF